MNDADFIGAGLRVVLEDVFLNAGGDRDNSLAFGHDGGVEVDRVKPMHGADQSWSSGRIHTFPCQPCDPSRHAGTDVEDVRPLFFEKYPKWLYLKQGG